MARSPRIEYPGAFYHVVNRGQSRGNMFLEGKGRQSFLDLLGYFAPFRPVVSQHSHWKNKTGSYVRNGKSEFVSFSSLRRQFEAQSPVQFLMERNPKECKMWWPNTQP